MDPGEERVPKLYGLGAFERTLVGRVNEAVNFLLSGLSDERQVDIIDQLSEGALVLDLQ